MTASTPAQFTVSDTRAVTSPRRGTPVDGQQPKSFARLKESITRAKAGLLFRHDLDAKQQKERIAAHRHGRREAWIHHQMCQLGFPPDQQVLSLKMMITEAERYQRKTNLPYLRATVFERCQLSNGTQAVGAADVFFKGRSVSSMVCADIDTVMNIAPSRLPPGMSPNQVAARAVFGLPLWGPEKEAKVDVAEVRQARKTRSPRSQSNVRANL